LRWRHDPTWGPPRADELTPILGPSHKRGGERVGLTGALGTRWLVGKASADLYVGDRGFGGHDWQRHWREDDGARVLTAWEYASIRDATERHKAQHRLSSVRQVVETVSSVLTDLLWAKFPRARTAWGLSTRIAAKIAAYNLGVYINHLFKRPTFSLFNPLG